MNHLKSLISKFFSGNQRSVRAKKNILASFAIKGMDVLVYFMLVPITLGYLNEYEYGIWLTLNSILMWINSFDIGLGNGMRNKLAEALAANDKHLCRCYVSTTFFMLCGLMAILMMLGSLAFPLLDWYSILGASTTSVARLNQIVFISFALFCVNFIFKFIGNVYLALQMAAVNNFLVCMGHALSLLIIFILSKTTTGSLFYVALAYSLAPPIIYLLAYPITFVLRYPFMAPSIRFFNKNYLKSLFSMGILFFIIQLGGLLLFSTSNIIISHIFGPENVTPFNIAQRYFSAITIVIGLILAPMWSASTDAYARGDLLWIQQAMKKVIKLDYIAFAVLGLMVIISPFVYKIWLGKDISISFGMTTIMAIYTMILIWSLSFSNFLNGMGKLRIQAINTIIVGILFIPLGIIAGKTMDIYGVIIALCVANLSGAILNTIQFKKVVAKTSTGIWNN